MSLKSKGLKRRKHILLSSGLWYNEPDIELHLEFLNIERARTNHSAQYSAAFEVYVVNFHGRVYRKTCINYLSKGAIARDY